MSQSSKTGLIIFCITILTVALFFFSVKSKKPPSFNEIFSQNKNPNQTTESLQKPTITTADPQKGPQNATITIVEFADFNCPYCAQSNKNLNEILTKYPNEVRLVWKDFPFMQPIENTWKAHVAARCAEKQNKFWEYKDLLFNNQNYSNDSQLIEMASFLNLNLSLFTNCLNNQDTRPLVEKAFQEGKNLKIDGTPTFYLNDNKIYSVNLELIEGLLGK